MTRYAKVTYALKKFNEISENAEKYQYPNYKEKTSKYLYSEVSSLMHNTCNLPLESSMTNLRTIDSLSGMITLNFLFLSSISYGLSTLF